MANLAQNFDVHVNSINRNARQFIMARKPPLGSGERFAAIEEKAKKGGAKDASAVAAAAGIAKYGQKKMTAMAQAGKRRAKKER